MGHKIALLIDFYLKEYIEDVVGNLESDVDFTLIPYKSLNHLYCLYPEIEDKYDNFATMGNLSCKLISYLTKRNDKMIYPISREPADYYRNFFLLLHENREINFTKVFLDFSLYKDDFLWSVKDFYENSEDFTRRRNKYVQNVSLENILSFEDTIIENAVRMFNKEKLDQIICQYGYVADALDKKNIPYNFVEPDPDNVLNVLELLNNEFKLSEVKNNLPATIYVTTEQLQIDDIQISNLDYIDLQKYLIEFNHEFVGDFIIQPANQGYEIFTSRQFVSRITEEFTTCLLKQYLFNKLGEEIFIGYGIGDNIIAARSNAIGAAKLALKNNLSCIFFDNNKKSTLDKAHASKDIVGESKKMKEAASKSQLSINTILRIKSVMNTLNTGELTTSQLAGALEVTSANANRFLNNLEKSGFAEVIGEKRSLSRGRPSKVYKIYF